MSMFSSMKSAVFFCFSGRTLGLIVTLAAIFCNCGEIVIPKDFHQGTRMYNLLLTEAALENPNPKFLAPGSWMRVIHKGKGTAPTLNAFFPFVHELSYKTNMSWIPYQKHGTKWIETVGAGYMMFCTVIEQNLPVLRSIVKASNFPHRCPVLPDNYTINDFKFEMNEMPPILRGNEYNVRAKWRIGEELIFNQRFGFKVDRTRELSSKKHKTPQH